jgi:DNA-directed RNA polymerase specialized sigma24 family protein
VLREFNGLSYRDIADVTGVAVGTVMSRLARARALLIERIGKELS